MIWLRLRFGIKLYHKRIFRHCRIGNTWKLTEKSLLFDVDYTSAKAKPFYIASFYKLLISKLPAFQLGEIFHHLFLRFLFGNAASFYHEGDIKKTALAASGCHLEIAQREVGTIHSDFERARRYIEIVRNTVEKYWKP